MKEEKRRIPTEALFTAIGELLAEDRQAVFTVTGMSMWPFLCHGRDQVVVERCRPEDLKKGDVILFRPAPETYLLHRITRLGHGWFETTGDGNCYRDGRFPVDCVRARVVKLIRKGREISCRAPGWRLLFRLWMMLFPARRPLLRLLVRISRLRHKKYLKPPA